MDKKEREENDHGITWVLLTEVNSGRVSRLHPANCVGTLFLSRRGAVEHAGQPYPDRDTVREEKKSEREREGDAFFVFFAILAHGPAILEWGKRESLLEVAIIS